MAKCFGCCLLLLQLFFGPALAHQPTLVKNDIVIADPEISRAFYDELFGQPRSYTIRSPKAFILYLNLLVPSSNPAGRYSARIYKDHALIGVLDGNRSSWKAYYEKFAGDNYFKGPEYKARVRAGSYRVIVFGDHNRGKYVLAVGEREAWPLGEVVRTLLLLPRLKRGFFGTSPWQALFSPVGTLYWIILAFVLLVAFIVRKYLRR